MAARRHLSDLTSDLDDICAYEAQRQRAVSALIRRIRAHPYRTRFVLPLHASEPTPPRLRTRELPRYPHILDDPRVVAAFVQQIR
ncbi:unnamed protein product [Vitrella brassicaformis CCMP3155]|uniref:Uncharacterized protein n=1 Tax=Vitrella brassicaformis (strain CCMP3155) TaxID=1169540 RepID=A0A0G4GWV0_VITBC|nr:unnamed protein product [Vitrella brassicaformis CCMP3155]|eukprot:CEM35471.1 unnamed protein product [Vitrella brassicaformis CCMP3155]